MANDPALRRIAERADDRHSDLMETAAALGAPCRACGMDLPQPTAGVLSLLELIESPFVTAGKAAGRSDLEKAVYIFHAKSKAVRPLFSAVRFRQKMDEAKEWAAGNPDCMVVWLRYANEEAKAWGEFDVAAAEFAERLGAYKIDDAVRDVSAYLSLCHGFDMIPASGDPEKKTG